MVLLERVLVVLLAGCGFQVRAEVIDAAPSDGERDAASLDAQIDGPLDAPIDATPDAPLLACPIEYVVTVTGSMSRYRISSTNGTFAQHHASCNDDLVGATHLAVFDTLAELDQITALLVAVPQPSSGRFYIGAVQMMNQTTTGGGWLHFTGGAVPTTMWQSGQPDDNSDSEADHDQQLAALESGQRLNDVSGELSYGAVCECDGKTIDPTVATHIP
ncbi:MAG: C-type lectin domain-containing protein [Deltaproteobacteria bacterium]|nr:C-type lectin domain-containing protein [Deltaproteobacteria bacterium]